MKASWIVIGVAAAVLGLTVSRAGAASFSVSVELAPGQTGVVANIGDSVTLNVYANMAGADNNMQNDGITSMYGGLKSSDGGLQGNLSFSAAAPFQLNTPWSNGDGNRSYDSDADLDIFGPSTQADAGWIHLNNGASASNVVTPTGDSNKVLLGTATFLLTDVAATWWETTDISWIFRNKTGVTGTNIYAYEVDGVWHSLNFTNTAPTLGNSWMYMLIPEPATMAVLAIGGLGVLLRRRRTA